MINSAQYAGFVKALARTHGFEYCGIAKASKLDDDARRLESWLAQGRHGNMSYMENHFDLRVDPARLVPGAKSVITVLKNYFPEAEQEGQHKIAKYAYGRDYHDVIRGRLKSMMHEMQAAIGDFSCRGFVDSAPVLERTWALRSGLGWIGKNGNLINKGAGSFFFIATLITDLEMDYDTPFAGDFCGTCTRCIDACPTDAILPDKVVDGSKCISYFTIELKDLLIPDEMKGKFDNWMFGCDACQDVCPWNRFSTPHKESQFSPLAEIFDLKADEWESLTEDRFRTLFKGSPLKRAKREGLLRNIRFLKA